MAERRERRQMLSLVLENLSKVYNRRQVFAGVNLALEGGQSLAVTGRNGSGKTTLLRIICGFIRPTTGGVKIAEGGRTLGPDERRRQLGLVAPDLALYDELTALENLQFFARVRGLRVPERELVELIESTGLAGRAEDLVSSFSSGMKQRLKYAFALLHKPGILLLDEPTSNLDEAGIALVDRIVSRQKRDGILILATNEAREVQYGDQVLRLGV